MSTSEKRQRERNIQKQWTPKLATAFTAVSDAFLRHYRDLKLTNTEAMLLIHLISYKWDDEAPFPSFDTLANRMGLTKEQVRAHALSLVRKKCLGRTIRPGHSNLFHFEPLFEKLEKLVIEYEKDGRRKEARRKHSAIADENKNIPD